MAFSKAISDAEIAELFQKKSFAFFFKLSLAKLGALRRVGFYC